MKTLKPSPLEPLWQRRRLVMALAGSGALAACGGGSPGDGSGAAEAQPQDAPSHPLGVGAGGTGFGLDSLISAAVVRVGPLDVGGVTLNTDAATFSNGEGEHLLENDIAIGMTAQVQAGPITTPGGLSAAKARSVVVDTQVRGTAQWLDTHNLLVLAQRISVGKTTLFGPGVVPGGGPMMLKIWGQLNLAEGRIMATRIERMSRAEKPMLRGLLTALDAAAGRIQIGALVARATDPAAVPAGLQTGALVRAVLAPGSDSRGTWTLVALRDDALRPPDNVTAELAGRVTRLDSATRFALDGVPVDASAASIEGAAYLALGAAVEVTGPMRSGVLVAREVVAEAPEPMEFEGRLDSCDPVQQLMTLGGLRLHWSTATVFTQGTALDLRAGRQVAGVGLWNAGQARLEVTRLQVGG